MRARATTVALLLIAAALRAEPWPLPPETQTRTPARHGTYMPTGGLFGARDQHRNLKACGGGARTEAAVDAALSWLASRQLLDGSWEGRPEPTVFALLAFIGAGETHRRGLHRDTVRRGLRWLSERKSGDPELAAVRGPAAVLWIETFAHTGSPIARRGAARAVRFLDERPHNAAESPADRAWRYQARLIKPLTRLPHIGAELEEVRQFAFAPSPPSDDVVTKAIWIHLRENGWIKHHEEMTWEVMGAGRAKYDTLPLPFEDPEEWYWGTVGAFAGGGEPWRRWNDAMKEFLLPRQRTGPPALAGSFDPPPGTGTMAARIRATSLFARCLEIYYLYSR